MEEKKLKNLAQLQKGEKGFIAAFTDAEMSLKLLEMGCLVGTELRVEYLAPFGDPICVSILGYQLAMRKQEAASILIQA